MFSAAAFFVSAAYDRGVSDVALTSIDELQSLVGPSFGERFAAVGQWPTQLGEICGERIGIFDASARPRVIADCWVARDDLASLPARLKLPPLGGWDVMFATGWRWAWGGVPVRVWSRRGWHMRVDGERMVTTRFRGREQRLSIASVCAEISDDWTVHRVGVRTLEGATVWIARHREWAPKIDPTYDGLNLLADAGWAGSLGRFLATELSVPYEKNDSAL
jgi:hypothetical protein